MTEGEVEFVRPHMRKAGVPDSVYENLVRQWADTGTPSFIQHLANSGVLPVSAARQLTLVFKGYVSLDVQVLFSRLPAELKSEPLATNQGSLSAGSESAGAGPDDESISFAADSQGLNSASVDQAVPETPEAESMSLAAFLSTQESTAPPSSQASVPEPPVQELGVPAELSPAENGSQSPVLTSNPLAGAFGAGTTPVASASSSLSTLGGVWSGTASSSRGDAPSKGQLSRAEVGANFGRYTLQEMLGEGSTSRIFRAFHETLGVPVAIKVYRPTSRVNSAELESKFVNEARMLARLDHPNIVRVLDVDIADHLPYIVFEYVGAMTLEELVQATGRLPPDRVVKLGIQIADALACASEQSVLHRDVKPANVLLKKDGTAKLADFGLATIGEEDAASVCGSPAYMAPEQVLDPVGVDHRADMYGLGATLYHAATGQPPFVRASPKETLRAQIHDLPTPIHEIDASFDEALSKLILQLLEKKPDARFFVWSEVTAALRQCMAIVAESAERSLTPRDVTKSTGRLRKVMSGILGK